MHINVDAGAGMAAGKAHLLDDVIGKALRKTSLNPSCNLCLLGLQHPMLSCNVLCVVL